jgi:hypothetical protein
VQLPPQCTFWRFLASLHLGIARQLLTVEWRMRERVWAAANVHLDEVTVDTDTTVHTLFGNQMGGRKSYNPKNKGKKSYQPILSFIWRVWPRVCPRESRRCLRGQILASTAGMRWRLTRS